MVTFETNGKVGQLVLQLPNSLNDLTEELITKAAPRVEIADNYSLIAVCYREKIANIILASNQKKNEMSASVVSMFVKGGATDNNYCKNLKCGDTLIVSGSDIALGFHVGSPANQYTIDQLLRAVDGDKDAYTNALKIGDYCYFLEFKIIPNVAIHGNYVK